MVKDREICEKFKVAIKSDHKISDREVYDKKNNKIYTESSIPNN